MRGEEVPHIYTAYTGLMGDRIYAVVAADGDPGHPWHTGRNQEEFLLYKARYRSGNDLLLPENLDATYSEWEPGIDPYYPDADAYRRACRGRALRGISQCDRLERSSVAGTDVDDDSASMLDSQLEILQRHTLEKEDWK